MSYTPSTGVSNINVGTLQASTSASTVAVVPSNSTLPGDLIVVVAYVTGTDCRLAKDAGDGWIIVSSVYDSVNTFGGFMAVMNAVYPQTTGYAGITLPGTGAYTAQSCSVRAAGLGTANPFRVHGDKVAKATELTATASSTTITLPSLSPNYSQFVVLSAGGYNNAGTTTTIGVVTSMNEAFDTGQASPPHGVFLDYQLLLNGTSATGGNKVWPSGTGTLAVAKTNQVGMTIGIPLIGNTNAGAAYKRMARGRRYG